MRQLAMKYHADVHAAERSAVNGEEEAQLTTPVANLFAGVVEASGLGTLQLVRETRTGRTRPDFAALLTRNRKTMQKGFIELKAPSVSTDTTTWGGRNATQWKRMSEEAEIVLVCNGRTARLYRDGHPQGAEAPLPYEEPENWDGQELANLLRKFVELQPTPVTSIADLTKRLAVRTRDLRDRIEWLLDEAVGDAQQEAKGSYAAWRRHVYPDASPRDFADGVAQTIAYGMVLAALTPGDADADGDGHLSVGEARAAIRDISPVLAAAFAPLLDKPVLREATEVEVGALETLISAIDPTRIATPDRRGDAWLRFYEDFLSVYDPQERREAGVYYTPVDAVAAMTAMTGHLLVERFNKRMGFGDASVVTLDPATGTGTFPLAAIDRAISRAPAVRGQGGEQQAAKNLAKNMYAFELLPGPYAVAHLRLSQRLTELAGEATYANVVLTDTLEAPDESAVPPSDFFGDQQVLAAEQQRANRIKREQKVTVVIGNPPYRRVAREIEGRGSGNWVVSGTVSGRSSEDSLFDDLLKIAANNDTNVSAYAGLYNLYTYFWRWALWKAFEAHEDGPGIVTFITGSSWLTGPGFVGLRQYARELADEIWILDLGGDNHGSNPEENIFAIETPVAIVTLVRDGTSQRSVPAQTHYRRIRGTSEAKLEALREVANAENPLNWQWDSAPSGWLDHMVPPTLDATWSDLPLVSDLFPWQQPGCKWDRTWPAAPTEDLLKARWNRFVASDAQERPDLFYTASSGRNIHTSVAGMTKLADLTPGAGHEPIVRFGYRSFDRQYAFCDRRLAKTESPSLWQTQSQSQIYLATLSQKDIGPGPALTVSAHVPDFPYFRGSYGGKDFIPLYRDAAASEPNITSGLPATLAAVLGIAPPSPEDIAAYTYALLASHAYQQRFAEALQTPGLRVPMTADAGLWSEAVATGRDLLWLQTYAERFNDTSAGRGAHVPLVEGLGWGQAVTRMPQDNSDISYDPEEGVLSIGDGTVAGVRPEVWGFSVSGMQVVPKWLGYRTRKGAGRATSSTSALDHIRPSEWADEWNDELLDLLRILTITTEKEEALADLLARVCDGELIPAEYLPQPTEAERKPPATL